MEWLLLVLKTCATLKFICYDDADFVGLGSFEDI